MKGKYGCSLGVLGLFLVAIKADVFTSTAHLSNILTTELEVVGILEKYVQIGELRLNVVKKYIKDFDAIVPQRDTVWVEQVVSNPLKSYLLIRRLTKEWTGILKILHQSQDWKILLRKINTIKKRYQKPTFKDLEGGVTALLRLQEVYWLNVSDLVEGKIQNMQTPVKLTAADCLYIGNYSFSQKFFDLALEWLDGGLRLAKRENDSIVYKEIKNSFKAAILEHDKTLTTGNLNYTFHQPAKGKSIKKLKTSISPQNFLHVGDSISYEQQDENYKTLCRSEKFLTSAIEKHLFCFLSTRDDPYFILHPIKTEQHYLDPPIYIFYDILSDREIEHIKYIATPYLTRSRVYSEDGKDTRESYNRTSKTTWLHNFILDEDGSEIVSSINKRVQKITKLNIEHSTELWQIANYGIGGHFASHIDNVLLNETEEFSDMNSSFPPRQRIATFMIYLSDVPLGGATVFTNLGTKVYPEKGKAIFWYNLRKSTQQDNLLSHGGCPVIYGNKWVANLWILNANQEFKRPCGLTEKE